MLCYYEWNIFWNDVEISSDWDPKDWILWYKLRLEATSIKLPTIQFDDWILREQYMTNQNKNYKSIYR